MESTAESDTLESEDFFIDKKCSEITDKTLLEELSNAPAQPSQWALNMMKRHCLETDTSKETPAKKPRRRSCFNCLGDHTIAQCSEPRNFARIRKNKNEFLSAQSHANSARISHTPQNTASKYKPGRIGTRLREMLNLGADDIPEYVYRMRRMGLHAGYPPAYLQKALIKNHIGDTLKFITSDKQEDEDEDEEDEKTRPPPTVDANKIHFYMGFNKTYGALKDREQGRYNVPPFDAYVNILQEEVNKQHEIDEKVRIREVRENKVRRKMEKAARAAKQLLEDADKEIVAESETSEVEKIAAQKKELAAFEHIPMGESMLQYVGTPVFEQKMVVPDLAAFAVGILPFEAREEETGERGTFKKLLGIIRTKKAEVEK
ncbi:unnamed protein product [Caenorhabditis sp. 36 PRJEB53466]|nr:unnamed protein product [Caenorhabditis sp. 36 PRJEB53466]